MLDYREPEWVAEKLGLDKNTVYKHLQAGWLPGLQLGRKWLISGRLLAVFLEKETRMQPQIRRKSMPMTPRLQKVLDVTADVAAGHGQDFVGTEHLLIAIAEVEDCLGATVLKNLGVDLRKPRELFEAQVPLVGGEPRTKPQRTDRARRALRFAQEQAVGMGHDYLGAEHVVLGLMLGDERDGLRAEEEARAVVRDRPGRSREADPRPRVGERRLLCLDPLL